MTFTQSQGSHTLLRMLEFPSSGYFFNQLRMSVGLVTMLHVWWGIRILKREKEKGYCCYVHQAFKLVMCSCSTEMASKLA